MPSSLNFPINPTPQQVYNYNGISWIWDGAGWAIQQPTYVNLYAPPVTSAQRNAIANPVAGQIVFDTTISNLCFFNGTQWKQITSTLAP